METLQLLPVCFLLHAAFSGDIQTQFIDIKCDKHIAEIGKDTNITCRNNNKITDTTVTFCTNETICSNSSDINTLRKIYTTDNGRITLKPNNNSVTLHITSIRSSDQRIYCFFISAVNGHKRINVSLEVVGPETAITERPILDKIISEEVNYNTIILVPIAVLAAGFVAVAWYWRKRKGAVNLRWRTFQNAYHQPRFPKVSF